jgi:MFS family permease
LIAASSILTAGFFGIQGLLKVLYVLRLGHGPEYVGLFNAAAALAFTGMSVPSGALGGRFGTRRMMLIGGLVTTVGMAVLPLCEAMPLAMQDIWPIASQLLITAGWSMFNVNWVPAMTAMTTPQSRGRTFAVGNAVRSLGTFVGTLSGGLLPGLFAGVLEQSLEAPGPYRLGLWVGATLGLVALVPLSLTRRVEATARLERTRSHGPFPLHFVVPMVVYVLLSHGGWATCQAFGNAYMDTDLGLSASSIGLVTGVGQFVAILAPLLTPRLAAHHSHGRTLMMTTLGMGASLLPLALIPHWSAAGAGRLGILTLSAIWIPTIQIFQMEQVDTHWRSLAYGAAATAMGLGYGTISLLGGYVAAAAGYRSLFLLGVALSTAGAAFLWAFLRRRADGETPPRTRTGP